MSHEKFNIIYERYAPLLINAVLVRTDDEELAKEICQQTFLAYYSRMDTLDPEIIKYWLLRVAENLLIDHWRKEKVRKEVTDGDELERIVPAPVNVEREVINRQFICWLMEDLKSENKLWYEVIDCICIKGMSHKEAAEHLGISAMVLRARLYRARRFIQAKYSADYREEFG